ncbi:MAG: DUF1349 domain-containing protein [Kordiimonadaceae bacterium]|nr:DUF1349 domain-containing protein [Kordiimonadaceae bacterium]
MAGEGTDWFEDPNKEYSERSAPVIWYSTTLSDFSCVGVFETKLKNVFDATGIMIRIGDSWWGKLAYELSPRRKPTIVSVISNPLSDDANGPEADGDTVHLRVIKKGATVSMHWRTDVDLWNLVRYCQIPSSESIEIGFFVQSPQGEGLEARVSSCFLSSSVPEDIRSGE